jgi:hypothetical protein
VKILALAAIAVKKSEVRRKSRRREEEGYRLQGTQGVGRKSRSP